MPASRRLSGPVTFVLGLALLALGILGAATSRSAHTLVPLLIGCALMYLGWRGGRTATIVLGHALVVTGAYLITWGVYLLPYSKPLPAHVFGRPLFWGFISVFGGVCAIYHGFCDCVMRSAARRTRPESS